MKNETLYLESDEEITSAIDKLLALEADSIKLVVPKSSTLLQSIVNQKLLKKAAADADKSIILVTTDRIATHLAGRVGLAVAASLKAEAAIPASQGEAPSMESEIIEETTVPTNPLEQPETVEPALTEVPDKPLEAKTKKPKGKKIPDFGGLQKKVLIAAGIGVLALALVAANFFFKRATVTLFAQAEQLQSQFDFKISDSASNLDGGVIKGERLQSAQEFSSTFVATGKKDVGSKASGQITATNYCYNPGTIPSGTVFTASGLQYVSTQAVPVSNAVPAGGACPSPTTATIPVVSAENGDKYNLAPSTYTTGGIPSNTTSGMRFNGSQMSGGSSKQITIVSQADLEQAQAELLATKKEDGEKELRAKVGKDQTLIEASIAANVTEAIADPPVGEEATSAKLTLKVTYQTWAVDADEFKRLVEATQLESLGEGNQIYDNGIKDAKITKKSDDTYSFDGEAYGGRTIDTDAIAKSLTGKKFGEATTLAADAPGVEKATVDIWPSWSSRLPRITKNIKVDIQVDK